MPYHLQKPFLLLLVLGLNVPAQLSCTSVN